jgi:hypothetical protein
VFWSREVRWGVDLVVCWGFAGSECDAGDGRGSDGEEYDGGSGFGFFSLLCAVLRFPFFLFCLYLSS